MQDSRINYAVVGAFVTVVLIAFLVVISMLAGRTGATDTYYTVLENVTGINFGTQVLYEGYQIGQVESVEPRFENRKVRYRVNLEVQEGWAIPEDSLARATVSGLLSAMTIDVKGGASSIILEPGAEIPGSPPTNIFAALSEIGAEFGDLSQNSLKPLIDNLNDFVTAFGKVAMEQVPESLGNIQKISDHLAERVPNIADSIQRSAELIETDILGKSNRDNIGSSLDNLESASVDIANLASDLDTTRELLVRSAIALNKLIENNATNVDDAVRDLRYTLSTIVRYVDDISGNLEATSRNMAEFSRSIRENPSLLLSGSPQQDAVGAGR